MRVPPDPQHHRFSCSKCKARTTWTFDSPEWDCSSGDGGKGWSTADACHVCRTKPSFLKRHHCRVCGHFVCGAHTIQAIVAIRKDSKPANVCTVCATNPAGGGAHVRLQLSTSTTVGFDEFVLTRFGLVSTSATPRCIIVPLAGTTLTVKSLRIATVSSPTGTVLVSAITGSTADAEALIRMYGVASAQDTAAAVAYDRRRMLQLPEAEAPGGPPTGTVTMVEDERPVQVTRAGQWRTIALGDCVDAVVECAWSRARRHCDAAAECPVIAAACVGYAQQASTDEPQLIAATETLAKEPTPLLDAVSQSVEGFSDQSLRAYAAVAAAAMLALHKSQYHGCNLSRDSLVILPESMQPRFIAYPHDVILDFRHSGTWERKRDPPTVTQSPEVFPPPVSDAASTKAGGKATDIAAFASFLELLHGVHTSSDADSAPPRPAHEPVDQFNLEARFAAADAEDDEANEAIDPPNPPPHGLEQLLVQLRGKVVERLGFFKRPTLAEHPYFAGIDFELAAQGLWPYSDGGSWACHTQ
jgi:hypothetical protein